MKKSKKKVAKKTVKSTKPVKPAGKKKTSKRGKTVAEPKPDASRISGAEQLDALLDVSDDDEDDDES